MDVMVSQITYVSIVDLTICSGDDDIMVIWENSRMPCRMILLITSDEIRDPL